jgi:hypothetical protein
MIGYRASGTRARLVGDALLRIQVLQIPKSGEMREYIGASIIRDDVAAAFRIAEPPDRTCAHRVLASRIDRM